MTGFLPCQGRAPAPSRRAFTLLEVLLATVIALLVTTLLASTYHTVITATRNQGARRARGEAARAVGQLARELQAAFFPPGDTNCVPRLGQTNGLQLEWCATLLGAREADLRWFDVTRICCRTVTNGPLVSLVRETAPLAGPAALLPPVTNELVRALRNIKIAFFDGEDWVETWPVSDPPTLPRAARIRLLAGDPRDPIDIQTEVFLPAGSVVRPPSPDERP